MPPCWYPGAVEYPASYRGGADARAWAYVAPASRICAYAIVAEEGLGRRRRRAERL